MGILDKFFNFRKEGMSRDIVVSQPGTLATLIANDEKYNITQLTLHGTLNGIDLRVLRDMGGYNYRGIVTEGRLAVLDMSDVRFAKGGRGYIHHQDGYYEIKNEDVFPERLFRKCISLEHVVLPSGIKAIEPHAFERCNHLTRVDIPEGVEVIGLRAFRFCTSLHKVELPASVKEIQNEAFADDRRLRSVVCRAQVPPQSTIDAFFNLDMSSISLQVPEQSVEIYKKAQFWKRLTQIEGM